MYVPWYVVDLSVCKNSEFAAVTEKICLSLYDSVILQLSDIACSMFTGPWACVISDGEEIKTDIILAVSLMQEKKPARNMNGTVLQANPVKNIITNTI